MEQAKIRSSIYLDAKLKEKAKNLFKEYGLNLSEGINFLLQQATDSKMIFKDLDIQTVSQSEDDYKLAKEAMNGKFYSFDEFLKI